jgi:hypothetical protein
MRNPADFLIDDEECAKVRKRSAMKGEGVKEDWSGVVIYFNRRQVCVL